MVYIALSLEERETSNKINLSFFFLLFILKWPSQEFKSMQSKLIINPQESLVIRCGVYCSILWEFELLSVIGLSLCSCLIGLPPGIGRGSCGHQETNSVLTSDADNTHTHNNALPA